MTIWPWLTLVGLGAYHGLNPAMGWLFAVALGQHRNSRRVVFLSLIPIALGHAAAIATAVALVVGLGVFLDADLIRIGGGVLLIFWAVYHQVYGHRHKVRFGMQTGMVGLGVWSFLMATAHGAGLMLVPVLIPLCLSGTPAQELTAAGSLVISLAAVTVHTLSMLTVTGVIALSVYQWLGLAFLRRGWINLDLLWTVALAAAGVILIVF
ncbi:hypothetical protein GR183_01655 [Stappia sp. GBMRC 2046]|uniref:Arginine/ornithine antiporter ArcD n=1 Tax=Stappia sediminis TaxID=2692190 RepID=A0A7X3LR69_9HYPH|nr:hypothetical protein [Stappia sediminis]MXN63595.1 hypothetical protein [Stappia sediminis]